MKIITGDLEHPKVLALLRAHLDEMNQTSPAEHMHALDVTGLQAQNVSFWTVWEDDSLMGCGALKTLTATTGEIKSMRTHEAHLRKGVAAHLLEHIISTAKERGFSQLSLETGSGPVFEAALQLYRKYGFQNGDAFNTYTNNAFSQCLHLKLRP